MPRAWLALVRPRAGRAHARLYHASIVFLSSFFSTPNLCAVTERTSTKVGYIFTYDCYLKNLTRTPRAFTLHGLGTKTAFWNRLWTLTEHISATKDDINNRKVTCQATSTLLHESQIWWTLVQKRLRTLASFCPPPKFSHWKTLPALPHGHWQTLAHVML